MDPQWVTLLAALYSYFVGCHYGGGGGNFSKVERIIEKLDLPIMPLYYSPHIPHRSPWVCLEDKTDLVFVHVCDSIVA